MNYRDLPAGTLMKVVSTRCHTFKQGDEVILLINPKDMDEYLSGNKFSAHGEDGMVIACRPEGYQSVKTRSAHDLYFLSFPASVEGMRSYTAHHFNFYKDLELMSDQNSKLKFVLDSLTKNLD